MIDPTRAFERIAQQHALGARHCGTQGHKAAQELLASWLAPADLYREHTFVEQFFGEEVTVKNLWGRFEGRRPGRILLGTHYDTRPWADRDEVPSRQKEPVPGANDGGSGTAILGELAAELASRRDRPTVDIVLFDAEDWHDIDGKEVSLGAKRFVGDLPPTERPDAVLILDMVGGRDLMLDVDVTCQDHDPSFSFTLSVFQLGRALGLPCFELKKDQPYKLITCDHAPFIQAGIPAALLIDIDYPPWHTTDDTPEHCDAASLGQMAQLLEALLYGAPTE